MKTISTTRRSLLLGAAASLVAPVVWAQGTTRNVAGFSVHNWQDHFDSIGKGILLSDTITRVLQHWTADGEMRVYTTSVPLTDELTRRGYTEVIEKCENPSWTPTPSMRELNPEWPTTIPGGDPANPLGTRALYLSWTYYRIHGTANTRKIGRKSSNGCIGLYNEQIEEVYGRSPIGTQVKLI